MLGRGRNEKHIQILFLEYGGFHFGENIYGKLPRYRAAIFHLGDDGNVPPRIILADPCFDRLKIEPLVCRCETPLHFLEDSVRIHSRKATHAVGIARHAPDTDKCAFMVQKTTIKRTMKW